MLGNAMSPLRALGQGPAVAEAAESRERGGVVVAARWCASRAREEGARWCWDAERLGAVAMAERGKEREKMVHVKERAGTRERKWHTTARPYSMEMREHRVGNMCGMIQCWVFHRGWRSASGPVHPAGDSNLCFQPSMCNIVRPRAERAGRVRRLPGALRFVLSSECACVP